MSGVFSGGTTGGGSCVVQDGSCSITSSGMQKRNTPSATFSVTNVENTGGLAYAAAMNHDADGDSDGTTIVVTR